VRIAFGPIYWRRRHASPDGSPSAVLPSDSGSPAALSSGVD